MNLKNIDFKQYAHCTCTIKRVKMDFEAGFVMQFYEIVNSLAA